MERIPDGADLIDLYKAVRTVADVEAANGKVKGEVGRAQSVASDLSRLHAAKMTVCEEVEQSALEATAAKARSLSATLARIDKEVTKSLAALRQKLAPSSSTRAKDDVNRYTVAAHELGRLNLQTEELAKAIQGVARNIRTAAASCNPTPIPPLFAEVAPSSRVVSVSRPPPTARKRRGARIALPGPIGSQEFTASYQAAISGTLSPSREGRARNAPGTIGALIVPYMKSANYIGLRQTTKAGYASRIEALRRKHGHRTVAGLTRDRIITAILQPYADRPGAAISILKMLRVLIRHAINIGWLRQDPSLGIKRPKLQRIRSWTEQEIAIYRARWPLGAKERTAFELFLNTGQRRSDVVRMVWSDIADGKIRVVQQKTGRVLLIPLHGELIAALTQAEPIDDAILTTAYVFEVSLK